MKQRRVGTFTLGITLVLIGIMVPLIMLLKEKAVIILQFAPIVLVFLGIEVLIYAIKFKEDKLRYDGVSIFLVIMITIVSIGTASIAPIITRTVKNERIVQELTYKGEGAIDKAFDKNNINGSADVYPIRDDFAFWTDDINKDNINMTTTMYLHWDKVDKAPTKEEIADKILPLVSDIDATFEKMDIEIILKDSTFAGVNLDKYDIEKLSKDRVMNNITIREVEKDEVANY